MNFYVREDILDSITPNNVVQRRIDAPHGQWRPAYWLPVQYTSSNISAGTDAYVISSGKAVALDADSRVVPAGLRTVLGSSFASTVLTYTSTDVFWGVTDLVTGLRVTAAITYDGEEVCDALIERGLVSETEAQAAGATIPVAADADCAIVVGLFISRTVGVAAYDVHVWSGKPEEHNQHFTNYSKQHGIQFLTEVQMQVPHRVAGSTTSDSFDTATLNGGGSTAFAAGSMIDAGEYWDITNIRQLVRYSALSATAPVVALGLANIHPAHNTTRTPVTADDAGTLVRERKSAADIAIEGDWYLDTAVGVIFLHTDTWATLVAGTVTVAISYDFYTDTGVAGAHRHIHFDGPVRPGQYVTVDTQSNFTAATEAEVAAGVDIVGRVLELQVQPIPLLAQVKTAWSQAGFSAANRMPGSATAGFTDLITLSGETIADQVVTLNVRVV